MSTGSKTYEMLWDCRFCGTSGLLGLTHRFCPSCGAPQDPETRYFPDDDHKVAVEDHVYAGADRRCPACTTPNSAKSEFCGSRGGPLTDAAAVKAQQDQVRDLDGGRADAPWRGDAPGLLKRRAPRASVGLGSPGSSAGWWSALS